MKRTNDVNQSTSRHFPVWTVLTAVILTAVVVVAAREREQVRRKGREVLQLQESLDSALEDVQQARNEIVQLQRGVNHVLEALEEILDRSGLDPLFFYLERLKDRDFTSTYGHGYTWHIAAEKLGQIGKRAIPYLVDRLNTQDDYERAQAFYALRLAAQDAAVLSFTGGKWPQGDGEAFPPPKKHARLKQEWEAWFRKYRSHWK